MYGPERTSNGTYLPALTILIVFKCFRLEMEETGIVKEEERKWADEDKKADDVDVTLHLYQQSTRYIHFSIKLNRYTSTWYLIPQQYIPHLPKWGASRSSGNDIIFNIIVNTSEFSNML